MSVDEFKEWQTKTKDKEKTMVEELAYVAVFKARTEFKERQEVTNRTEGMPQQKTDITTDGQPIKLNIIAGGGYVPEPVQIDATPEKGTV